MTPFIHASSNIVIDIEMLSGLNGSNGKQWTTQKKMRTNTRNVAFQPDFQPFYVNFFFFWLGYNVKPFMATSSNGNAVRYCYLCWQSSDTFGRRSNIQPNHINNGSKQRALQKVVAGSKDSSGWWSKVSITCFRISLSRDFAREFVMYQTEIA